jgi:hypothetical protein
MEKSRTSTNGCILLKEFLFEYTFFVILRALASRFCYIGPYPSSRISLDVTGMSTQVSGLRKRATNSFPKNDQISRTRQAQ